MHTAQASDNAPCGARLPHWSWSQPERYCGRAGYRWESVARAAPAEVITTSPTDLHCPLRRLADGSRPPTPEGSQHGFPWGHVATPIQPITGWRSLAPSSCTRSPIGSPCGSLSLAGGLRAYHVASPKPAWVRSRLYAGGSTSALGKFGVPSPGHVPFGPGVSASCACSCVTTFTALHLG